MNVVMTDWYSGYFFVICASWLTALTCSVCHVWNFATSKSFKQKRSEHSIKHTLLTAESNIKYLTKRIKKLEADHSAKKTSTPQDFDNMDDYSTNFNESKTNSVSRLREKLSATESSLIDDFLTSRNS